MAEQCCKNCKYSLGQAPDWRAKLVKGEMWCVKWNKAVKNNKCALACWRPMV